MIITVINEMFFLDVRGLLEELRTATRYTFTTRMSFHFIKNMNVIQKWFPRTLIPRIQKKYF